MRFKLAHTNINVYNLPRSLPFIRKRSGYVKCARTSNLTVNLSSRFSLMKPTTIR